MAFPPRLSQLWEVLYSRVNKHRLLIVELNVFGGTLALQCVEFFTQLSQTEVLKMLKIRKSIAETKLKGAILELKRRHLKKTAICYYTPYPAKKIRRICASSSQEYAYRLIPDLAYQRLPIRRKPLGAPHDLVKGRGDLLYYPHTPYAIKSILEDNNFGVTCEDKAKRRNSGAKMKTFEENCYLLLYAVSSKEDTAYLRQLITRIRVKINSRFDVSMFTYTPWCMTRSSTKELLMPFENPEQVLLSRRKLFETSSLAESNSPEFDQNFEIEEQVEEEEEVTEIMAENMDQYMSKTHDEFRLGIARPTIDADIQFELKGQFLKEFYDNTFSGLEHEDANEHIEKVAIQEMAEYSQKWHNGTSSRSRSTKTFDGLAAIQAQLNSLGREIKKVNEKVAPGPGFYQRNNGNSSYPAQRDTMEESLTKFMAESPKRHEDNSNIIKEVRASTDAVIRNQGASIKTLELQIGQISKVLQKRSFGSPPNSTETNSRDQVKSISTATANLSEIRRMEYDPYAVSVPQHRKGFPETVPFLRRLHNYCCDDWKEANGFKILEAYDRLPQKEKDPGSFTLPCFINNICFDKALVDLRASVSVMLFSTYTNLGLGVLSHTRLTIELADRIIKQPRGIAENVLVRIGKFVFLIDFIILDIPDDDDVPLILGRPFLSTAHVKIDVFKRKVTLRDLAANEIDSMVYSEKCQSVELSRAF
ncbi:retrovirus-related pol polyprotein from transposon TNT 1-94 [Tanacetum coccineum]